LRAEPAPGAKREGDVVGLSISVVICAYTHDRWEALAAAVQSVQVQTLRPLETIVVIDHDPSLVARAQERIGDELGVRVIENADEPGLSSARNKGLAEARGDIVAFLDDDAIAERDWLELLTSHYRDSRVIVVGGAIEPAWVAGRPKSFPPEFDWVVGCTYVGLPEQATPVRNVIGANMSFRREVFASVGGFDPAMGRTAARPLGCEETELCLRAKRRWPEGLIMYEPLARVRHTVPPVRGTWGYFLRRCYAEGLSKAHVARLAGPFVGLQSERAYVARVVPRAIVSNTFRAITRRDARLLGRAARMVAGVAVTTAGYGVGRLRVP
jgi:glucosyl-dolichyl phosphate glucuronosyltransferase